jgi:hypothetical protein
MALTKITSTNIGANAVTSSALSNTALTSALGYTPANKAGDTFTGAVSVTPAATGNKILTYDNTVYRYGIAIQPAEHRIFAASDGVTTIGNVSSDGNYTFTERMRVDTAGRVTMPSQPSFEVSQASIVNISGANYYFTYSTIHHNVGSHYSSSNGRFTAPVTGVYLFQAVAMGIQTSAPHIAFSINGATNGGGGNYGTNNMWEHGSYSQNANWVRTVHIVKLTAGDYIRVQAYDYSSTTQPERCYFGGHLLG